MEKNLVGYAGVRVAIDPGWKVLDIGSGHSPNPRADVLLDKNLNEDRERGGQKLNLPAGKIFVEGDALDMPFKDKEFDYIIASHIAEHVDDPEKFCSELSRVHRDPREACGTAF